MIWDLEIGKTKLNIEHTLKTVHFKIGRSINASIGYDCFIPFQKCLEDCSRNIFYC